MNCLQLNRFKCFRCGVQLTEFEINRYECICQTCDSEIVLRED